MKQLLLLIFTLWAPTAAAQVPNDFALQDGDTVVLLGGSNNEMGK